MSNFPLISVKREPTYDIAVHIPRLAAVYQNDAARSIQTVDIHSVP
jgi:hypothetical protein